MCLMHCFYFFANPKRAHNACASCRSRRRRCEVVADEETCIRCSRLKIKCEREATIMEPSLPVLDQEEDAFVKMFEDCDQTKPQFVCATQPLASILSKDSVLCFDGDAYGLYYPWRGEAKSSVNVNSNLMRYLESENALVLPSIIEQRRLVGLYFRYLYPFYPVVSRMVEKDFGDQPLILLNAIFLAATRFDETIPREEVRKRLSVLYKRCKLLELVETNKVVLIQAYILLSTHEEGMEGVTSSKEYVAKACNLCGELAITDMGFTKETPEFAFPKGSKKYPRNLLKRLLWTTFCCDRHVSATSGREMIFNELDFYVEPLKESDFDSNENSQQDYLLFHSWYQLALLIERIQCALYRPPPTRSTDSLLQKDLESWSAPNVKKSAEKIRFLRVTHAYLCLLYLRRGIDSVALLLHNTAVSIACDDNLRLTIEQIHHISNLILELLEERPVLHHIVAVHGVLHVVALLQLELTTHHGAISEGNVFKIYYNDMIERCLKRLEDFKAYWWFAGSALRLCRVITSTSVCELQRSPT